MCFRESEDTVLLILKEIYAVMGIRPSKQHPELAMQFPRHPMASASPHPPGQRLAASGKPRGAQESLLSVDLSNGTSNNSSATPGPPPVSWLNSSSVGGGPGQQAIVPPPMYAPQSVPSTVGAPPFAVRPRALPAVGHLPTTSQQIMAGAFASVPPTAGPQSFMLPGTAGVAGPLVGPPPMSGFVRK